MSTTAPSSASSPMASSVFVISGFLANCRRRPALTQCRALLTQLPPAAQNRCLISRSASPASTSSSVPCVSRVSCGASSACHPRPSLGIAHDSRLIRTPWQASAARIPRHTRPLCSRRSPPRERGSSTSSPACPRSALTLGTSLSVPTGTDPTSLSHFQQHRLRDRIPVRHARERFSSAVVRHAPRTVE